MILCYGKTIVFFDKIVNSSLNTEDSQMSNNYDSKQIDNKLFESESFNFFGLNLPYQLKYAILQSGVNLNQIFNKELWESILRHDIDNIKNNHDTLFNELTKRSKYSKKAWFQNQMEVMNFCYMNFINQKKQERIREYNKYSINNNNKDKCCGYCGTANVRDAQTRTNSLGLCTDCCVIYYCNQHCQLKDYPRHIKYCQKIKNWINCITDLKM